MDDPDQSPLVSSSSTGTPGAGGQDRWKPQQPLFQYQFVAENEGEPEEEEDDDEEDDDDEEVDDERLEVRERKPAAASAPFPVPASAPPLVDLGEQPPRPPPAPQLAWTSHSAVSSSSTPSSSPFAPSGFEVSPPEEKEKEPPRSAPLPPPPAPPHREETRAPAVPPRSAPLPPKREEPPAAAKKGAASGSPDETLFAPPVASEPLMHSSADKGMDLQEQLGRACSASQEDFAAVPLDATASLPSLSPLSANPFKEYAALDAISDGLSAKGSYGQIGSKAFHATSKNARNPFLADDCSDGLELQHSEVVPPYPGTGPFFLSQMKEPVDAKVKSDIEKLSTYQQDSSPDSPVELFVKHDEDVSLEDEKYDISDHDQKVAFLDHSARDEYVDFKPFEPSWASSESSSLRDVSRNQMDGKSESDIEKQDGEKAKTLPVQKDFEKDNEKQNESSNEDISFPSTPEASKEFSEAYITCAKFESAVTIEGSAAKSLVEKQTSGNKTDEKKIAEMKAHFGTEPSISHIESASGQKEKAASDKGENLLKSTDAMANMPEGLTPDLVQEAYESELHDAISPKLAYESKVDLVQMSESPQEPLKAAVQLCPSFEGEPETAPSPVLPDIVMEAPLNASTIGAGGPAMQLGTSPLGTFAAADNYENDYENVMQKSEEPPSYQEAMNVPTTQMQETKVEAVGKGLDSKNGTAVEDLENSYISIACDLVKETKASNESASPDAADKSKAVISECASQPVPEYTEHLEKISGKIDSFGSQQESDLAQKEREAVKEKIIVASAKFVPKEGWEEELPPSFSKPYLESFQPHLEPSKDASTVWSLEAEPADLARKGKVPKLDMEELRTCTNDFSVSKEPKAGDKIAESSPETNDFPTVPYQAAKLVMEATGKDVLKENESRVSHDTFETEARQPPYQVVAHDLSLKNVHVKTEEQDLALGKPSVKMDREVPEIVKEPLPPTVIAPLPAEKKVINVGKEAERGVASVKEKEKSPPMFSSKLSKPSVVDLLYWRDVKKTGVVFGVSLFLLLSLTVFSIVSVVAYIALFLLSVSISFRIYKGVIQAIQKSDEGHPFRAYLDKDVAVSEELVQKYSHMALGHINSTVKELRRLFLVDDLVDSLKFAVLMWVFTYVGALFNGLTLLILALISLFSIPVIYEKHQVQIDHYLGLVNKNFKDAAAKIQAKIPGLKRKAE
ncbi:reticulon-4 isoform X1 [Rhineura floridana]|uniref:reticulon-4 isoform X1 n=1 Tax=Rhineura floridana TaxID=261503 RepID=UPI002AC8690B|nr:reticulon-4 isoform X1 [Rhineura floridana]